MNGLLTVRRARYRCSKTKRFYYPLDEMLDLPSGEVTVSLGKRALRLGTYMSFSALQEELRIQHEVRLSDSVLNRLMQAAGGVADGDRAALADQVAMASPGLARESLVAVEELAPHGHRLYVSCDGAMYPTRYREDAQAGGGRRRILYQEMKCGTVFWQEPDGAWQKRVLAGREDGERFGASLWALAVGWGMLRAREVIFISDGGAWCETVARTYFRGATRILDWYHLSEHVWETGRALYADEGAVRRWVSMCLSILAESSGIGLLRYLRRSRRSRSRGSSEALAALDRLADYLRPRLAMTDYVDYRAAGCVIGSGLMEATCKQLVGGRLKGSGRQWSESGAVAMAALLAHRINGTWDRFWATRPLQRAA